ncbi:hypothetical protein R0K18_15210 [Pantoea sp. SIMBA_133]
MIKTSLTLASQITGMDLSYFTAGFTDSVICLKPSTFQSIIDLVIEKKERFCRISRGAGLLLLITATVVVIGTFLSFKIIKTKSQPPEAEQK